MRILNRPMFKYGGPIKEGVMHGMRDGGRAALVGNPLYPRTGSREHHQINIQDPRKGAVKKGGIWLASKVPGFTKGWAQRMWNKYKFPSAYSPTRKSYHQTRPMMERLGKYVRQHPIITGGGAVLGSQSDPVRWGAKTIAQAPVEIAQFATEVLTPKKWEKYLPENEWWKWKSKSDWKPGDIRGEEGGDDGTGTKTGIGAGAQFKEDTAPILTESQKTKLAKDQQNKRLKSYLDMMGYDSAKKTALSDALIDASAIVQQGTEEAGSLKEADWGKMINKAIQTTSKRLDKPAQIREAVGLMSVKAAIEKDLEDPQVKKLRALQIEDAEEKLNAGFEKDMADFIFGSKTTPDKAQLERYARLKADEHGLDFTMITDEVIDKIPEDATEKERMEKAGIVDDGIYMIGTEIIRVKDGNIKQIA